MVSSPHTSVANPPTHRPAVWLNGDIRDRSTRAVQRLVATDMEYGIWTLTSSLILTPQFRFETTQTVVAHSPTDSWSRRTSISLACGKRHKLKVISHLVASLLRSRLLYWFTPAIKRAPAVPLGRT